MQGNATVDQVVERIGRATTEYIRQDRRRRAFIRALAVGLGIGFAVLFQIDTLIGDSEARDLRDIELAKLLKDMGGQGADRGRGAG